MNLHAMTACPACESQSPKTYSYPEGDIHICGCCKLQWAKGITAPVGDKEIYSDNRMYCDLNAHYMSPASLDIDSYAPYARFLDRLPQRENVRILDVGCGNGAFIAFCLRHKLDARGIEINPELRQVMPEAVAERVQFVAAEDIPRFSEQFDIITFWDSFEHIEFPFAVLENIRKFLKPGGKVFVRTNNSYDIFNLISMFALRVYPSPGKWLLKGCFNLPQHYWNFNPGSMERMLRHHDWSLSSFNLSETPVARLTPNKLIQAVFSLAYLANKAIGGGKIGEYEIAPATKRPCGTAALGAVSVPSL